MDNPLSQALILSFIFSLSWPLQKHFRDMKALLTIYLFFNLAAYSQNCKITPIKSYEDTLHIILEFESHLFLKARSPLINKLNSLYTDYEEADTCFLFLIPDSQIEFASDGHYVSQHLHKATLDTQKNVRWIEIVELTQMSDYYRFAITTNKYVNGKKRVLKKVHYQVNCKGKKNSYKFKRKRIAG